MSYTILDELADSQQLVSGDDPASRPTTRPRASARGRCATSRRTSRRASARLRAAHPRDRVGREPEVRTSTTTTTRTSAASTSRMRSTSGRRLAGACSTSCGALTDEERARTGHHETYGDVTVDRYLRDRARPRPRPPARPGARSRPSSLASAPRQAARLGGRASSMAWCPRLASWPRRGLRRGAASSTADDRVRAQVRIAVQRQLGGQLCDLRRAARTSSADF